MTASASLYRFLILFCPVVLCILIDPWLKEDLLKPNLLKSQILYQRINGCLKYIDHLWCLVDINGTLLTINLMLCCDMNLNYCSFFEVLVLCTVFIHQYCVLTFYSWLKTKGPLISWFLLVLNSQIFCWVHAADLTRLSSERWKWIIPTPLVLSPETCNQARTAYGFTVGLFIFMRLFWLIQAILHVIYS